MRARGEQAAGFRLRGEQGGLYGEAALNLLVERFGGALVDFDLAGYRVGEPGFQVDVENLVTPEHQKNHRHAAEEHRADHQLGADAGAEAFRLARHVKFDEFAGQDPADGDHQDENQRRDGPINESLLQVRRTEEIVEAEGPCQTTRITLRTSSTLADP